MSIPIETSPPEGSGIRLSRDGGVDTISIDYPSSRVGRAISLLASIFFAGVVAFVCFQTYAELDGSNGMSIVLHGLFLLAWVLASFIPLSIGYLVLQRTIPESITILGKALIHDSGRNRFQVDETKPRKTQTAAFSRRRKRTHFSAQDCETLTLTDIPVTNRIFIEKKGERIDLASGLAPEHRAWLFAHLKKALEIGASSISPEGSELIRRVLIEESKPEPIIRMVDPYSEHEVDPLDFDDPMAQRVEWKSIAKRSASYRSHKLVETPTTMEFTSASGAIAPLLVGCGMGAFGLWLSLAELARNGYQLNFGITFLGLASAVFVGVPGYLVYRNTLPIVFDFNAALFYFGWSLPAKAASRGAGTTDLADIHALQLISHRSDGDGNYDAYELNLVLHDERRVHVVCHGDAAQLREDAQRLAQRLGKPLWDGIRGKEALASSSP